MHDNPLQWPVRSADGHQAVLRASVPPGATRGVLFAPAMGVAARHYDGLAAALAERGLAVAIHEWRGLGSSSLRASRRQDWGYRELLELDLRSTLDAASAAAPAVAWHLGGHSLGAQFALLLAATDPRAHGMLIIAGGAPYWRTFPGWQKLLLRGIFGFMNGLGTVHGYFPGRRTGFAGNEARGVIRDWTRTGRSGHYRVPGLNQDYEHCLHACRLPLLALRMADDWYVPRASLDHLLEKLPHATIVRHELTRDELGGRRADHFGWMKHPETIAQHIVSWATRSAGQAS